MGERMAPGECLFSGGHLWETVPGSRCLRCDRPADTTSAKSLLLARIIRLGKLHPQTRGYIGPGDIAAVEAEARRAALSESAEAVRECIERLERSSSLFKSAMGLALDADELVLDRAFDDERLAIDGVVTRARALLDRLAEPAP